MSYFNAVVGITCLLQIAVAGFALRLNHFFGTARVGWSLFGAFAALAALHLNQVLCPAIVPLSMVLHWSESYLFITILLLVGLAHIEIVMRAHDRAETAERRARTDLELRVTEKTDHLVRANQNLEEEIQRHIRTEGLLETAKQQLEKALARVKQLSGLLPICSRCKKIRDEAGQWRSLESYISNHSEARFTHGLCPECSQEWRKAIEDG